MQVLAEEELSLSRSLALSLYICMYVFVCVYVCMYACMHAGLRTISVYILTCDDVYP
jgi:hypothetical protein